MKKDESLETCGSAHARGAAGMRRDRHGSGRRPRGHHHGYDRCRPARGNRDRHSRGHRQCLYRRVRHRGSVPGRRHAAGCLPHHRGPVRIQPDDSGERGAAARAAGDRQLQAGAVLAPGDRHRHRRCSARRHVAITARRQRRPAAGAGITGQRPQLDAVDNADAGQPHQQRERLADAGHLRRVVSAEHGRPAGDAAHRADRLRAAAVQPRGDGGIPVHHQPVRRDAGPVERRPGERRHEVGDQRLFRIAERLLPSRQLQREGLHRRRSTAVLEPADHRHVWRAVRPRPGALLRLLRGGAQPAVVHVHQRLPVVQYRAARRHEPAAHGRGPRRHPTGRRHAPDGARQRMAGRVAVRPDVLWRRDAASVAMFIPEPRERQCVRVAYADVRSADTQRAEGRLVAHRIRPEQHPAGAHAADQPLRVHRSAARRTCRSACGRTRRTCGTT